MAFKLLAIFCLLAVIGMKALALEYPEKPVLQWEFNSPEAIADWGYNDQVSQLQVQDGVLRVQCTGRDPNLYPPDIALKTAPLQRFEIKLKSPVDGIFEVFWAVDHTSGPYNTGFTQEHSFSVRVKGDNKWHVYSRFLNWQFVPQILALRLDPPRGEYTCEIAYMRIYEPAQALPRAETPDWDFTRAEVARTWLPLKGVKALEPSPAGLECTSDEWVSTLITLTDGIDLSKYSYLYFEGETGQPLVDANDEHLLFTTSDEGKQDFWFPLPPAGQFHAGNFPIALKGKLVSLSLDLPRGVGSKLTIKRLALSEKPLGPADLWVRYFGRDSGVIRAGRPELVIAAIDNLGGTKANSVTCRLVCGPGLELAPGEEAVKSAGELCFEGRFEPEWQGIAAEPGKHTARLEVKWDGGETSASCELDFTPPVKPARKYDYVPQPKPLKTPYKVGCYYFPGWYDASRWVPIKRFFRKPLLGYYAEGDPEIMDWQIKWALEHGIRFWIFDWYWNQGHRSLEHALHEAFFNARYQDMMQFSLLWANHNPPHTSSYDDLMKVCDYWIENYFKRPNYLRIAGKPAVWIFTPHRFSSDMGEAEVKRAFDAMRAKCKAAGLGGLYLIGCGYALTPGFLDSLVRQGYDAASEYNAPSIGAGDDPRRAPFSMLVDAYEGMYAKLAHNTPLPYIPCASCGWDSRPWHGYNTLARTNFSPAEFERELKNCCKAVDEQGLTAPGTKLFIAEAWNEWGEGSICEPGRRWGFAALDAFRKALAPDSSKPEELIPRDLGLKVKNVSFDFPTAWEFPDKAAGWQCNERIEVLPSKEALVGRTVGQDPIVWGPSCYVQAAEYDCVEVELAVSGGAADDFAELFFLSTANLRWSQEASARLPLVKDGKYHTYVFDMRANPAWRGTITSLRLDPCEAAGVDFKLKRVAFCKAPPEGEAE